MAKYKKRKDGRYATTINLGNKQYTVYGKTSQEVEKRKDKKLSIMKTDLFCIAKAYYLKIIKWFGLKIKCLQ